MPLSAEPSVVVPVTMVSLDMSVLGLTLGLCAVFLLFSGAHLLMERALTGWPPQSQSQSQPQSQPQKRLVLVVDGIIGAGKTTFTELLAAHLRKLCGPDNSSGRVVLVPEPVDAWCRTGALAWFYGDRARRSLAFQCYVSVTRADAVLSAVREAPDWEILVMERSLLTDRYIFMAAQEAALSAPEMAIYTAHWSFLQTTLPFRQEEALHVYLRPSLEECMRRTTSRARPGELSENAVTSEYQAALLAAHDRIFLPPSDGGADEGKSAASSSLLAPENVLLLRGDLADGDFRSDGDTLESLLSQVTTWCQDKGFLRPGPAGR